MLQGVLNAAPAEAISLREIRENGADVECFTYGFLHWHSRQLAKQLRLRLQRGCVSWLLLPRGALQIATAAALEDAGASVCPIPQSASLSYLLHAVQAFAGSVVCIVAMRRTIARLEVFMPELQDAASRHGVDLKLLDLEPLLGLVRAACSMKPLEGLPENRQPPFVLLTSGSRRLKAVRLPESALLARCRWAADHLKLSTSSIYAQRAPVGFVDSLTEVWPVLLAGGQVATLPEEGSECFWRWLTAAGASHCTVVPALLETLQASGFVPLPQLQVVVSSGEALRLRIAKAFATQYPHVRLLNLYGLTECCGDCLAWEFTSAATEEHILLAPLGWPLSGVEVKVLPANTKPTEKECANGEVGILWVRGAVLAEGYWRVSKSSLSLASSQQEEDCTAFVDVGGSRWLNTGDLVHRELDPLGPLHFVGREGTAMLKVGGMKVWIERLRESIIEQLLPISETSQGEAAGLLGHATKRRRQEDVRCQGESACSASDAKVEVLICNRSRLEPSCGMEEVVVFGTGSIRADELRTAAQRALRLVLDIPDVALAPLQLRVLVLEELPRLSNLKPDWRTLGLLLGSSTCLGKELTTDALAKSSTLSSVLTIARRLAEDQKVQEDDDLVSEWGFSSLLLGQLVVCLNNAVRSGLSLLALMALRAPEGHMRCTPRTVAELIHGHQALPRSTPDLTGFSASVEDTVLKSSMEAEVDLRPKHPIGAHPSELDGVASESSVTAAEELRPQQLSRTPPSECIWSLYLGKCCDAPALLLPQDPAGPSDKTLIIAGSLGGAISCFSNSGEVLWKKHLQDRCVARCLALAGPYRRVIIATWGGVLYCVELSSGKLEWVCNLKAKSRSGPVAFGSSIWAGNCTGELFQIDGNGCVIEKRVLDNSGVSDLRAACSLLFVVFLRGQIVGIRENAVLAWRVDLGCAILRSPLVLGDWSCRVSSDGTVSNCLVLCGCIGGVAALRLLDGSVAWKWQGAEVSMPILPLMTSCGTSALVADTHGRAFAFQEDGATLGSPLKLGGVPSAMASSSEEKAVICLHSTSEALGAALVGIALQQSVLVLMWRLLLRDLLPGVHVECNCLHILPGNKLLLGTRDDFLHVLA